MWYFTWVLGLGFACALGIINAIWVEFRETNKKFPTGRGFSPKKHPTPANE
ncbi:MAG: cytochrome bd-I oxidase subunit CydX [Alphaproteobacteria bacterium]